MELLLLRHGESLNNTLPPAEQVPDPELTALGRRQAGRLAEVVAALAPAVVICSPLLRALDTAQPLVAATGARWLVWADAAESHRAHPGDGQPLEALRRRYPGAGFEANLPWPGYPGVETAEQAAVRGARLAARLRATFAGQERVAVVAHGTLNGYLLRACLGAPQDGSVQIEQGNACINQLLLEAEGRVRLLRCNDCRHAQLP